MHLSRNAKALSHQVEADHRIANSLQFLTAMVRQEKRRIVDQHSAEAALDDVIVRLSAAARLHKQSSQAPSYNYVCLERFLEDFCMDASTTLDVDFVHVIGDVNVTLATGGQICIILNEFVMNAVKHGRQAQERVIVTIEAARQSGGGLRITLSDNGRGLPKGFDFGHSDGLGMLILTTTVDKLKGHIRPIAGSGAAFEILLPYH